MAKRFTKESVLDFTKNSKLGYKVITDGNKLICYAGKDYMTIIFTETEDGKAYTERKVNDLPKKYRKAFGVQPNMNEKGEIEYIAYCIEYGEKFIGSFYAPKGTKKQKLLEMGQDLATAWGGECYKVIEA